MKPVEVTSLRLPPINPHGNPIASTVSVVTAASTPHRKPDDAFVREKASSATIR
jgi:hypothetical protein